MSDTKTKTFSRIGTGAAGLAVLLVIIGAINLIIANLRLRVDLTAEKLYTLSDGSRQVLGKLTSDVVLKFYFSSSSADMPMGLKTYANQVQDLLKEYEIIGKGHVTLEAYDPKPDSDSEEWAQRYGIEPQQTNPFGQPVYFGLVAVCGETEQVIPGLNPRTEATLEYDLTRLITRVAWPEKPVLGVLSSLSVLGAPQNPMMMMQRRQQQPDQGWTAFRELRKDYTVREVKPEAEEIDADIKTLIVLHPKNLSDKTLFAIDQFVLHGGRLIVCVDPFSVADFEANQQQQNPMMMQMGGGGQAGPSTLGKLFDSWGVTFDTTKIVADMSCATKLNAGNGRVEDNPAFLSLGQANMAKGDLLTAQLSQIMMPFAGSLSANTSKEITFTPLITTSTDNACLVDQMNAQFGMSAMRAQLRPDNVQRVLAARLQGNFKTAFPKGVDENVTNTPTHLTAGTSTVMIFGDVDFLNDRFCVQVMNSLFGAVAQPINDNLALFANTVEQFAGREELIGVRSRGQFNRPFSKVDQLEAKAMVKWQAEEQRLESALQETRQRLSELQQKKTGNEKLILSKEQQAELEQFRKVQADTSKQLKAVRKNLNKEIEQLGLALKVVNIALIPLLVIGFGLYRSIQRKKH